MSFFEPLSLLCNGDAVYHYALTKHDAERVKYGWTDDTPVRTLLFSAEGAREDRINADVLIDAMRELDVLERRQNECRLSFYMSERWFKPPLGMLRLLHPRFFKAAFRMARLLRRPGVYYLAQGPAAARDMARICDLMRGRLGSLFRAPKITYSPVPGSRIYSKASENLYLWGYFVSPSSNAQPRLKNRVVRVLWVGRLLSWKRVRDLVVAVKRLSSEMPIVLDIYGEGPERGSIESLARGCDNINIHGFVKSSEVRALMRDHDVYVLPSNGYEGWGATVSEALEEGMCVYGTYEAGSTSAMLPRNHLYHSGDVAGLIKLLRRPVEFEGIGDWNGRKAAENFKELVNVLSR